MKRLLLGGVLGGLLAFIWGAISWMALPWHEATLKKFSNEDVVSVTLQAYAPEPGVYVLPNAGGGTTPEEKKLLRAQAEAAMKEGPNIFASIRGPMPPMGLLMAEGLITQILAALLVTWLLLKAGIAGFRDRWLTVLAFAAVAGLVGHLPNWIWWGFSPDYTLLSIADMLIGWGVAGVAIAWAAKPEQSA